jgi:DNA-binding NarL/FixJ family response regulator
MALEFGTWCERRGITEGASPWLGALGNVDALSGREREVFDLLGAGRSNREISKRLFVTERTVKKHVGSILEKLGVESRLQAGLVALAYLIAHSEIDPPSRIPAGVPIAA